MSKHAKSPEEAVELLGIDGGTVLTVGPSPGFVEALAAKAEKVFVVEPPPELELPKNAVLEGGKAKHVLVWLPDPDLRERAASVDDGGTLWTVLPRINKDGLQPVKEADVRRSMLVAGWKDQAVVGVSPQEYAIGFRRRR